jgi:hypothetical protein
MVVWAPDEIDFKIDSVWSLFPNCEACVFIGDLTRTDQMLEKNRIVLFEPLASYLYIQVRFVEALICAGLVRNGRRKILTTAKQRLVQAELESLRITPTSSMERKVYVQELYDL